MGSRTMLIDIHAHALSDDVVRRMVKTPGFGWPLEVTGPNRYRYAGGNPLDPLIYDVGARLDVMKRRGVTLQLLSPPPSVIANGDKVVSLDEARLFNESTAWLVAHGDGRLAGFAVPALGEPTIAADELRRAIDRHGFVGVVLSTAAGPLPLDHPAFEPLFATIEALDLLVFMHPTSSALSVAQTDYTLRTLVGWPTETTIAVTRLIFAGVLERHPRLKIVLSHGGGTLANLAGRLDLGWSAPIYEANPSCRANITRAPSSFLKDLYYDTVVADPAMLDFLVKAYGTDHVLFGTDFPYEIGDADGALAMPALERLPPADRAKITTGNVPRLLGHRAPALA
jgi:aminocarboxymuconate-semialdehyde decarboxylase